MTTQSTDAALAGGGEMGALIRAMDWSKTALGPVSQWPQSLLTSVSLCLSSTFPILIAWGPERVQIYNDAYRPICGDKHPRSMGQAFNECWASALPAVGHVVDRAQAGSGSYIENLRMFLDRHGYLEEAWMTFSFSPIRDESGGVGGLFHPITEVTDKMLGERRTSALQALAQLLADAKTVTAAWDTVAAAHATLVLDVPFLGFYRATGSDPELVGLVGATALADAARFANAFSATAGVVELAMGDMDAGVGPYEEPPTTAVVVPVFTPGRASPYGWLVAGVSARRALDPAYRAFFASLGATFATAISSVLAHEQDQQRAEALAQIDRAKTAFFSNVSHEFRTPLTLMLGPTEDALQSVEKSLSGDRLASVHRNGLRLLKLVNTLLDFSRIEAGRLQASFVLTDLAQLTVELASNFRSLLDRAGLTLDVQCPPLDAETFVDRASWEKIVLNLLSNAFKFTHAGGISVSLRHEDGAAVLEVRDSGVGIPADELPKVFERFHRIEGTKGRSYEGSGIGLALVRELVTLHGGSIAVDSTVGVGTTFTVTLPTGHAHLPAERVARTTADAPVSAASVAYVEEASSWVGAAVEAKAATPVAALQGHVLLADDNGDMRAYVSGLLSEQGLRVTTATDGEDALAKVRAHHPDLVLSDVMMPVMDGFGLLRALRADPAIQHVPVMLLSARAGEEARVEGLAAGADAYLVKPFSAKELVAQVAARLEVARVDMRLRAAVQDLREAHDRKDEFLAMLAHELRNPIAAISMALTVISHNRDGGSITRNLGIAQRQTATLVRLVDDLLDVARITRGSFELRRVWLDFKDVLANAVSSARAGAEARRHTLALQVADGAFPMLADETRLEQVVINVINNAVKYTADGGRIDIALSHAPNGSGRKALLRIRDNGRGIPREKLEAVFDIFYQVDATVDRATGGLGLGLSLVKRLVDMHAGRVDIRSEGAGRGTEVTIELPLRELSLIEPAPNRPAPVAVQRRRVLVVEDEADLRDTMRAVIEHLGHDAFVAASGEHGVAAILEVRPDVAFVDLGLPGIDGLAVARRVRAVGCDVQLVALTGYGGAKALEESSAAGFDAHLVKPIDPKMLAKILAEARPGQA